MELPTENFKYELAFFIVKKPTIPRDHLLEGKWKMRKGILLTGLIKVGEFYEWLWSVTVPWRHGFN